MYVERRTRIARRVRLGVAGTVRQDSAIARAQRPSSRFNRVGSCGVRLTHENASEFGLLYEPPPIADVDAPTTAL
jgi:hypothetical protein